MNTLAIATSESVETILIDEGIEYLLPPDMPSDDVDDQIQYFRYVKIRIAGFYGPRTRKAVKMAMRLCDDMITTLIDHRDRRDSALHKITDLAEENRELKKKLKVIAGIFEVSDNRDEKN